MCGEENDASPRPTQLRFKLSNASIELLHQRVELERRLVDRVNLSERFVQRAARRRRRKSGWPRDLFANSGVAVDEMFRALPQRGVRVRRIRERGAPQLDERRGDRASVRHLSYRAPPLLFDSELLTTHSYTTTVVSSELASASSASEEIES